MGLIQTALRTIYPPRCIGCGTFVDSDFGLCATCWGQTEFIGGAACDACGVPLPGADPGEVAQCDTCLRTPPPWAHGRAALIYAGMGRTLVLGLKHGDRQEVAAPAARWMLQRTVAMVPDTALIAPVPLHWQRLVKRRYNQSALIAKHLSDLSGCAWCPDLLERPRRTATLDGKTAAARAAVLEGAIRVHPRRRHRLAGRTVVLVDDVLTTGATLSACTRACLEAGAHQVCVSVLARAVKAP